MIVLLGPVGGFVVKQVAKKTIKKFVGRQTRFARVTTFQGDAERLETAVAEVEKNLNPPERKHKGAKGGYMLVDAETGKVVTVTFWKSLEDLNASTDWATEVINQTALAVGAQAEPTIEVYEVAAKPED